MRVVPRGGFSRVNRSQLGLPAGQQPARVGGFGMVEEQRHSVVVEGDARCHSVGDRGNEPHLFLIHFLAGWHHCLESICNNSSFDSLVFGCQLAVAGGFKFRNLNNLREASRRHHQLRLWQIIQMSSCQIARKSDKA